ncbi:MAG: glycerophosphodiester phosphodiesterase [Anaerolineae bacterium]|nr:glycerophosphodiester phosphodiesterase [Anaerolineae bacterium]
MSGKSFYLDRPLNFAHRGASRQAPENTLAAFLLAVELGADGIELDVQLSRDGEVVVIHDFVLETTTNGAGPVRERTLAELRELDAGRQFADTYAGQQIPTLQEVIDTVGDRLLLNIELKTASWRDDGLAGAVVQAIEHNLLLHRTVVSSFNPLALRRVRKLSSNIRTGLLYAPDLPLPLSRPWARHLLELDAIHPHHSLVDDSYVPWARERGYRVHTWTVDDPGRMRRLMRLGVDILITNRPDLFRKVLQTGPGEPMPDEGRPASSQYRGE